MIGANHRHYKFGGIFICLLAVLYACKLYYVAAFICIAAIAAVFLQLWKENLARQSWDLPEESGRKSGVDREKAMSMKSATSRNEISSSERTENDENRWPTMFTRKRTGLFKDSVLRSPVNPDMARNEAGLSNLAISSAGFANSTPAPAVQRTYRQDLASASYLGSPISPVMTPVGMGRPSPKAVTLPRVRRIQPSSSYLDSTQMDPGRTILQAQRRYPTHQPQYGGLGILPSIKLQQQLRGVLGDHNSTMLNRSVTVKIAPPDVLKPPTPIILHVEEAEEQPTQISSIAEGPCNTETVLSALREKRKRTLREDETVTPSTESEQASKRRRQHPENAMPNGGLAMDVSRPSRTSGLKRPALSSSLETSPQEAEAGRENKRTRGDYLGSSRVRNPIEVSFSSSKRWMERQIREQSFNKSRDSSRCSSVVGSEVPRPQSQENNHHRQGSKAPSTTTEPTSRFSSLQGSPVRQSLTADEESSADEGGQRASTASTSTPMPGGSGRSTPLTMDSGRELSEGETSGDTITPKKKRNCLLKKEMSTKRRLTPVHTDLVHGLKKVPALRQTMTVEDLAQDRQAELKLVQEMLDDVDEAERVKQEKKLHSRSATPVPSGSTEAQSIGQTSASVTITPTVAKAAPEAPGSTAPVLPSLTSISQPISQSGASTTVTSLAPLSQSAPSSLTTLSVPSQSAAPKLVTVPSQPISSSGPVSQSSSNQIPAVTAPASQTLPVGGLSFGNVAPKPQTTGTPSAPTSSTTTSATTTQFSFKPIFSPPSAASSQNGATSGLAAAAATTAATSTTPRTVGGFAFGAPPSTAASANTALPKPNVAFTFGPGGPRGPASTSTASTTISGLSGTTSATMVPGITPTLGSRVTPSTATGIFARSTAPAPATSTLAPTPSGIFAASATTKPPQSTAAAPAPTFTFGATAPAPVPAANFTAPAVNFTAAATNSMPVGAANGPSTAGAFTFGKPAPTGNPASSSTTVSAAGTTFQFKLGGQSSVQAAATTQPSNASTLQFGAPKPQQQGTVAKTLNFDAAASVNSTPAIAPQFGAATQPARNTTPVPTFGAGATAGPTLTTTASASPFQFGATNQSSSGIFGQNSAAPPDSSAAPSFGGFGQGTTQATTAPSIFGQTTPGVTSNAPQNLATGFQFNAANNKPAPSAAFTFGQQAGGTQAQQNSTNIFGSGAAPPSTTPFGQTAPSTGAFGSANQNQSTSGGFGTGTKPAFGSLAGTSMPFASSTTAPAPAFGANSATAAAGASKGFDFGATTDGNKSFNFGQPAAPAFGTPQRNAAGTPTFNSPVAPVTPFGGAQSANNMFSVAPASGTRPRTTVRAARRRPKK